MNHLCTVALYLASLVASVYTLPEQRSIAPRPRPLVLWHGLGDSYASPGILDFLSAIKEIHPGIFTHSIYMAEDLGDDRSATYYGNVNAQVGFAAQQIAGIPELQGGFDAIGFSQGGQFLRAYVERYSHAVAPVHNLITFGSQHMGISDIPPCGPIDLLCRAARDLAKKAVYGEWAQEHLVQAQYYRDPARLPTYLEANHFLTSINNEILGTRNKTYARNLANLDKLVLVLFENDQTVFPKESAWFGSEAGFESANDDQTFLHSRTGIIPVHEHPLYIEDWIGLRTLDERGGVVFETCDGNHMQIGDCWEDLVRNYTGTVE